MAFASSSLSIPNPQQYALRFTCLVSQAEIRGFHVPHSWSNGWLRCALYAGGATVPCRQLGDLQPDPTPQTLGSGPRPVNPRRSV